MTLLFPLGLAALASLLLPLLIHLARRTEQRPTDFAALRWLRQKPRPRHRPRFDELPLLIVRLLLLAALALVLALPMLTGEHAADTVIAVAPGADVPDTPAARRIWLAPGFPPIDTAPPAGPTPIGSLIRQLDAELPTAARLTLVVPRILDGADAERPMLSRVVTWRIAGPGRAPSPAKAATPPTVRYDPAAAGARYVVAAVRALGGTDIAGLTAPLPTNASVQRTTMGRGAQALPAPASSARDMSETMGDSPPLIWLASGSLPEAVIDHVTAGHVILVGRDTITPAATTTTVWRDSVGATLVEAQPLGRGRILRFTRPLTSVAMPQLLEPDFPRRLAALFAAPPDPARVLASAYAPQTGGPAPTPPVRPLWPWLAVAVAALFLVERWLATRTTRAPAP